jgi:hypothetical protein
MLHAISLLLGLASALTSGRAALLWRKASIVSLNPRGGENSGVHSGQQDAWTAALMEAYSESSILNGRAAGWSATAAILSALMTLSMIFQSRW